MARMSWIFRFQYAILLIAQTAAWGQGPPSSCSNETLSGTYVYAATGHFAHPTQGLVPMAEVARFTFDPTTSPGTVQARVDQNIGGAPGKAILQGAYDVVFTNGECKAAIALNTASGAPPQKRLFFVLILDRGRTLLGVDQDGDSVLATTWRRLEER